MNELCSNNIHVHVILKTNNSQIIYKNVIKSQNVSLFGLITHHDPVHMDFSCYYSQPGEQSLAIRLKQRCGLKYKESSVCCYMILMEYVFALQQCVQADDRWSMELLYDHEGLHQLRPS